MLLQAADRGTDAAGLPFHALALVAAFAAGVIAQGGYYPSGRILVAALVAVAAGAVVRERRSWTGLGPLTVTCGALALWAVARAAVGGRPAAGLPALLTIAGLVGAVLVVKRADGRARRWLAGTVVAVGALAAVSGWAGVALHRRRWAVVDAGLWRGGGTVTYPNALAALLAALSLVALALLLAQPRSPALTAAAYLLLVGLGATMSRAGVLALLVGLTVLALLAGVRATLLLAGPVVLGAVVAFGALVPSVLATAAPRPFVAALGLAAGLTLALALSVVSLRASVRVAVALTIALACGWAGVRWAGGAHEAVRVLAERRITVASSGRSGALSAVGDLVSNRPIAGTGPGQATLSWTGQDGRVLFARYAHDEYLQVLVELGTLGLALLLAVGVAIAVTIRRGRDPAGLWAGAAAAIVALALHSGFDFLWQLPVIPLTVGLLVGLAGPAAAVEKHGPAAAEKQLTMARKDGA